MDSYPDDFYPDIKDRVDLWGYGLGTVIGVYRFNIFPIHILFDDGDCQTFTIEDFLTRIR